MANGYWPLAFADCPHLSILQAQTPELREGLFIKKNKDRWERLEIDAPASPDEMAKDFTRLVDDLAYAKTFYPTSRVTRYINSLAAPSTDQHRRLLLIALVVWPAITAFPAFLVGLSVSSVLRNLFRTGSAESRTNRSATPDA